MNIPVFDMIFVPVGAFFRLKTGSLIALSVSFTVNDNNFPSSIDNVPTGLISNPVIFGVAVDSFDGSLVPAPLIAETL